METLWPNLLLQTREPKMQDLNHQKMNAYWIYCFQRNVFYQYFCDSHLHRGRYLLWRLIFPLHFCDAFALPLSASFSKFSDRTTDKISISTYLNYIIIVLYQTKDIHKLYVVCTFRSPLLSPWRTAAAPSFVPNPSDGLFDMVVNLRRIWFLNYI